MAFCGRVRTREFLSKLDHERIVGAIADAETKTSGEIRVYVQRGKLPGEVLAAAQKQFRKLGMEKTQERNAVLIFVAPRAQKLAVVGDEGVHEKCGQIYWQELIEAMRTLFQNDHFNQALLEAIEQSGALLARYFPKSGDGGNELPDTVIEGQ